MPSLTSTQSKMDHIDQLSTQAINRLAGHSASLDLFMIGLSKFGVPLLVGLVAAQWWRRDDRPHVRHVLVATALSFLLGLGLNQIILLFVHRPRPYDAGVSHLLIGRSADWSFPSDHATATMAIAAAFLIHRMTRAGLVFLLVAVLMMASRVYVGAHYVSDVIGGALTGVLAASAVAAFYREGTKVDRLVTGIL
jgi:undecaprenyl-diphosphatase